MRLYFESFFDAFFSLLTAFSFPIALIGATILALTESATKMNTEYIGPFIEGNAIKKSLKFLKPLKKKKEDLLER